MVQLWNRKKKLAQTSEEVEALKGKLMSVFSSHNIVCENFKNYEITYFELFNNENIIKLFNDEELVNTANLFFENNLNISLTSAAGYMHRNTLIYRLDKIKLLIGLDIRNFNEAGVFQNLIILHKLEKVENQPK